MSNTRKCTERYHYGQEQSETATVRKEIQNIKTHTMTSIKTFNSSNQLQHQNKSNNKKMRLQKERAKAVLDEKNGKRKFVNFSICAVHVSSSATLSFLYLHQQSCNRGYIGIIN